MPHHVEGESNSAPLKAWQSWLRTSLMKQALQPDPPPPLKIKNPAEMLAWSWQVKGAARDHAGTREIWKDLVRVLPQTLPWDAKVGGNKDAWIKLVLDEGDARQMGLGWWLEASLESRLKTPEIRWLTSTAHTMETAADKLADHAGEQILRLWVGSTLVAFTPTLYHAWTPLVELWSRHLASPDGRWATMARQALEIRSLVPDRDLAEALRNAPSFPELDARLRSVPDLPVFGRLPWQDKKPQWHAVFEACLALCADYPLLRRLDREVPMTDVLNTQAIERSRGGPHMLPVGDQIWASLRRGLDANESACWEGVWLSSRLAVPPEPDVVTPRKVRRL
jgi:hypothetical protein